MNTQLTQRNLVIEKVSQVQPVVNILLPFEPQLKKEMFDKNLQEAIKSASLMLLESFPYEVATPIMHRLHTIKERLNFYSYAKSIVILTSALTEKIIYTDIELKPTVNIDDAFHLRDILLSTEEKVSYLILAIDEEEAAIYLGNERAVKCIKDNLYACHLMDNPAGDFKSFSRFIDKGLSLIRQSYPYPVLITGVPAMCAVFQRLTVNLPHIVGQLSIEKAKLDENTLPEELTEYIAAWKKYQQQEVVQEIEDAFQKGLLLQGEVNVSRGVEAKSSSRVLIIDKKYPLSKGAQKLTNAVYYIKDNIDRLIERILRGGGRIVLMDSEYLNKYGGIVLL